MRYLYFLALLWGLSVHAAPVTMNVCLGDSLTEGGVILNGSPNFCEIIQTSRAGPVYKFSALNAGKGGNTSTQGLTRWTNEYRGHGYKRVIILLGTNDLANGIASATIIANLETIISQALADGMEVIICTIPPRGNGASYSPDLQSRLEAVNSWIMSRANTTRVDLYTAMGGVDPTKLNLLYDYGDGLHFNAAGHAKVAELILAAVSW